LLTSTPLANLTAQQSGSPLTFPHFADGGGYTNSVILLNTSSSAETGTIRFRNGSGTALPMTLNGVTASVFTYDIPADGAIVYETAGAAAAVTVGSIEVAPAEGSNAPVGSGIFRFVQDGVVVTESGVPAARESNRVRVFVDRSGGHDTGIAFANPTSSSITLTLSMAFIDGIGSGQPNVTLSLPPRGHTSQFIGELFFYPAGSKGVVEVSSQSLFSTLTLRSLVNERGEFLLTTFPVADMTQPAPLLVFPQIADGGGYKTEVILISPGDTMSSANVSVFDSQGRPLPVR
jgi:hypothetical protein